YTVSAPIAGKVLRNPREVGDQVTADETVVAVLQPMRPSFLDIRTREELQAALAAAEAAETLSEHEVHRLQASLDYYRSELRRVEKLKIGETISAKAVDEARFNVETNVAAVGSAQAQLEVRRNERASIAARLANPTDADPPEDSSCCIQIRAPVTGRVLKLIQESENVVQPGTPLIDIGDPRDLEVVADLLSTDAVQVKLGSTVRIDGWGGPSIQGRVARIDPAGFLKVSALGIEEQRVRTRIDFVDPPELWSTLGHDYRVIVYVTIWQGDNVLTVPVGALFRVGEDWAVFTVKDGRARTTLVKVDHRNDRVAEVASGLSEGDQVILHPSDRITEGVAVEERPK
ncbi:MAG: HlyD family efflux transporter periplasmic adaptor subunit, partial [Pseudolabrys sp.]